MPVDTAAPTTELGQASEAASSFTGSGMAAGWSTYIDTRDYAPKMNWPARFEPTERMLTDSQIEGLAGGVSLPTRRLRWVIDPQDARGVVAEGVAKDWGLPIKGQKDFKRGRRRGSFSHDAHLVTALRAPLGHGFRFFEQYGEIGDDGLWHLRKFADRSPRTMINGQIRTAPDGGLVEIVQGIGRAPKPIPVNRLVAYVWDQEAGNWTGRSMLRGAYRPWLAKDLVFRVTPLLHERNGMGVPVTTGSEGMTQDQLNALAAMGEQYRSGERASAALPHGSDLKFKGVEGTIPDGPGFMRFCNEEMAKGFLAMFMQLGTTETGSRSLGTVLLDYFSYCIEAIADWYAEITTAHGIEDWVDWNYGPDEEAPALAWERVQDEELDIEDLCKLVEQGIIQVDPELESDLRRRYKMPTNTIDPDAAPSGQSYAYDLDDGIITLDERRAQIGLPPRPDGLGSLTVPEYLAQYGGKAADAVDPQSSPPEPAVAVQATAREKRRRVAAAADESLSLPDRPLRRQPYSQEVQAKVDYELMDAQVQGRIDELVGKVKALQEGQITELAAAIESADNDLAKLAQLEAAPVFSEVLEDAMLEMAAQGVEQAVGEAERQGITAKVPDLDTTGLTARANAVDTLLSRSLSEAAGRKAVSLTAESGAISAAEVGSQVMDYLLDLSDQYLQKQLSGATVQAMNTGRKAVFAENPPKYLYASELLDQNACDECVAVDGTEYDTLEEAEADYPTGGYCNCKGGPDCRGTLVAVHVDEAAPSQ